MRTATALLVAVVLAVAAVGAAGTVTASVAATDDATAFESTADATALQSTDDGTAENLTVTVQTPRTVAKNVTQNYSVAVDGATGNVTATWTFDGETKKGTTVQHAWEDGGNATITVTVVDESGASVTEELTVEVVAYGSADDDPAGSTPFRAIGSIVIIILAMGIFPAILYMLVLPTVMAYFTDEFS
jgi:hypothetical protein